MSAAYNASTNAVTLTIAGKPAFLTGGRIVVNAASPSGITDTLGAYLDGTDQGVFGTNGTLIISPRGARSLWCREWDSSRDRDKGDITH